MAISSIGLLATLSFVLGYGVAHIETSHQTHSSTFGLNLTYRPSFHFHPSKNWMNDPNGPMRYKGLYHIFYQHNPKGAVWSNSIAWGHSISKDLVNWYSLQHALTPTKLYDINGCWSGSATMVHHPRGKVVILYTGVDHKLHQTQNLAVPKNVSDPLLREWVKSPKNPAIAPSIFANKINATSFRDPSTAWLGHDNWWRVVVGSQEGDKGVALLFLSKDFVHWVKAKHPLHSAKRTGMWECPDFFPVLLTNDTSFGLDTSIGGPHVRHVLKVSFNVHDYYLIGTYDTTKDIFIPGKGFEDNDLLPRYDYGKFYASKTFYDGAKRRRVLWGWINESSVQEDDVQKGWAGIQAIPRTLWLHKSGKQLIQWPIEEIEKLRTKPVNLHSKILKGGTLLEVSGVTAAQADVEISFEVSSELEKAQVLDPSYWKLDPQLLCSGNGTKLERGLGPFGLLVLASKGMMQEYTSVFFTILRANKNYLVLMCSDQSRSSLNLKNDLTTYGTFVDVDPVHEELSLRSLIDHSVVESFGGKGKACIAARVYPTLAINDEAHLHAFNNGTVDINITRLRAWSMKKANIN